MSCSDKAGDGCSSPRPFTLSELADLGINQTRESGCGPQTTHESSLREKGWGFPNNGEFVYAGKGSACKTHWEPRYYGCECSSWNVDGNRGVVQRTRFSADPTQCCSTAPYNKIIGDKTCDPKYLNQYKTTDCDALMLNYCNQGDNWTKQECIQWVAAAINNGRDVPNAYISTWCADKANFATDACQKWCSATRRNQSMRSACDISLQYYCRNNPTDPNCTCLEPPEDITKIQGMMSLPKSCWYKPCKELVNKNYMTSTMEDDTHHCYGTVCSMEVGNVNLKGDGTIEFNNECGSDLLKPEYKAGKLPLPSTPSLPALPPLPSTAGTPGPFIPGGNSGNSGGIGGLPDDTSKYIMYGGIGLAVLIVLIIFIMIIK